MNAWTFGPPKDETQTYTGGDRVPHRGWEVSLNGVVVGRVEIHLHRHKGKDGIVDLSFGATFVSYGPLTGEK